MKSLEEAMIAVGYRPADAVRDDNHDILEYLNLKLAARGAPIFGDANDYPILKLGRSLLEHLHIQSRLTESRYCPADQAIQSFLADYLRDVAPQPDTHWLPMNTMVLERTGLARTLSLPPDQDHFESSILNSYRVYQGICHNPSKDRRTTAGVFHVVEGGFAVPADKREVPRRMFALLLVCAAAGLLANCCDFPSHRLRRNRPNSSCHYFCDPRSAPPYQGLRTKSRSRCVFSHPAAWSRIWILSSRYSAMPATRTIRITMRASMYNTGLAILAA